MIAEKHCVVLGSAPPRFASSKEVEGLQCTQLHFEAALKA